MAKAINILRLADDFESKLTPDGEPYYEPFEDVEISIDPHAARHIPQLRNEEGDDEFHPMSTAPAIHYLSEEGLKRSSKLIYVIWFEAEVKLNHYIKNTINYMNSGGIQPSIILNFKDLASNINDTAIALKQLAHWKAEFRELQSKSEILHNEISNLSEYINGLVDMYSLFDFYLEDLHSKGEDNTSEYRLFSMSARSVDKIRTLLELAKEATLKTMQHKKYVGKGEWRFE